MHTKQIKTILLTALIAVNTIAATPMKTRGSRWWQQLSITHLSHSLYNTLASIACVLTPSYWQKSKTKQLSSAQYSFSAWKQLCDKLPLYNRKNSRTPLTSSIIDKQLNNFHTIMQQELKHSHWLENKNLSHNFFADNKPISKNKNGCFQPFVQKIVVPAGSQFACHGDLHGDVHSLNHFLQQLIDKKYINNAFKIIVPNFYMVFLGDYTDRGTNGIEVLSTIMRLKVENPQKVFLTRGNHEDYALMHRYGFYQEIQTKFANNNPEDMCERISCIYHLLPLALYIGTKNASNGTINYIQCCHGGIEARANPINLLKDTNNYTYANIEKTLRHEQTIQPFSHLLGHEIHKPLKTTNGYMWSDFAVNPVQITKNARGCSCAFETNQQNTHDYLQAVSNANHKVRGFFRAHQHGDDKMARLILSGPEKGVGKLWNHHNKNAGQLWDGIVCTFSVAPAYYQNSGYTKDYFGILTTASAFENWRLEMFTGYDPAQGI